MSGGYRRRAFARGDCRSTRRIAEPDRVLDAHRPQRRSCCSSTSRISIRWCDPAGGSYYIENLTQSIAEPRRGSSSSEVGGEGRLRRRVRERLRSSSASTHRPLPRTRAWRKRRITLLGCQPVSRTSTEVGRHERRDRSRAVHAARQEGGACCNPYRGAMAFEADASACGSQRQDAQGVHAHRRSSGHGPRPRPVLVQLLRLRGHPCAGQHLLPSDLEEGVKAALESKAEIVVLCSSDDDYADARPRQSRSCSATRPFFVVAGAPACMAELEAQGISNFIQREEQRARNPARTTLRRWESKHAKVMRAKFSELTYDRRRAESAATRRPAARESRG